MYYVHTLLVSCRRVSSPTLLSINSKKMSESGDDDDNSFQSADLLNELFGYCKYEDISEEGIREIIKRFGNQRVDNYSFFRAALSNEKVTEDIFRCLLECFPAAVNDVDFGGQTLLHYACKNKVSIGIIRLLIDAAPDSVRHEDNGGQLPLHCLCNNEELDEASAVAILRLLLEKHPESIQQHVNNASFLPIHIAIMASKSPEFCGVLIDAYPGCERITVDTGMLPLHLACMKNSVATVEYLYNLFPDSIEQATSNGMYPIHISMRSLPAEYRADPGAAVDIVKFLLDCDPSVKFQEVVQGESLLHYACRCDYGQLNTIAAMDIIKAIYDAHPEFIRKEDNEGHLPLHTLCANPFKDHTTAMAILGLLLEKYPDSIRHADDGFLPIHAAAGTKSLEFCRVLIEAYPGSERMPTTSMGMLPFHYACMHNTFDTVKYLYNLYPDAIDKSTPFGMYPIHATITSVVKREANPEAAVDIVKFLLDCDPRVKYQKLEGAGRTAPNLPLACVPSYNFRNIGAAMEIIEAIYDADPEVIGHASLRRDDIVLHPEIRTFVNRQVAYFRAANNTRLMTTPGDNGQLPLHRALQNNIRLGPVRLGSIKLLVKGNRLAVRYPDNRGALPLHVACMHHRFTGVVEYLIELDTTTLDAVDYEGNTVLHYACNGAKFKTIALLLDKYDAVSVSKRNAEGKLPIEVLWEKEDRGFRSFKNSVKYTEIVFRLLRAYPAMMK